MVCHQSYIGVKEIRAIVRSEDSTIPKDDKVKQIIGDFLSDVDKLSEMLKGSTHVIFAAAGKNSVQVEAVDHVGLGNTALACKKSGVKRLVVISSQLVDPVNRWHFVRILLNTVAAWGIMDAKFAGENLVKKSGQEYTIVRPGGLGDGEKGVTGKLIMAQTNGSYGRGATARSDVASVCIAALDAEV